MSGILLQAAIWAGLVIVAYAVLARGLFRATDPARFAALELAQEMMAADDFPESEKQRIDVALDDMHSPLAAWQLVLAAALLLITLPFHRLGKDAISRAQADVPSHWRSKHSQFVQGWNATTIGNSPLAAFLFALISLTIVAFSISGAVLSAMLMSRHGTDGGHHNGHAQA